MNDADYAMWDVLYRRERQLWRVAMKTRAHSDCAAWKRAARRLSDHERGFVVEAIASGLEETSARHRWALDSTAGGL